ncbi:MAG: hypothetical protein ACFB11_00825 [Paracoccaceae bacterium]
MARSPKSTAKKTDAKAPSSDAPKGDNADTDLKAQLDATQLKLHAADQVQAKLDEQLQKALAERDTAEQDNVALKKLLETVTAQLELAKAEAAASKDDVPEEGGLPDGNGHERDVNFARVVGPKRGRWRAGTEFGQTPTFIDVADVTEEMAGAINGDDKLTLTVVTAEEREAELNSD